VWSQAVSNSFNNLADYGSWCARRPELRCSASCMTLRPYRPNCRASPPLLSSSFSPFDTRESPRRCRVVQAGFSEERNWRRERASSMGTRGGVEVLRLVTRNAFAAESRWGSDLGAPNSSSSLQIRGTPLTGSPRLRSAVSTSRSNSPSLPSSVATFGSEFRCGDRGFGGSGHGAAVKTRAPPSRVGQSAGSEG
jgi:hypothetical protein